MRKTVILSISILISVGVADLAAQSHQPSGEMDKRTYYNTVIAPRYGRSPMDDLRQHFFSKSQAFADRKRSVLDVGNLVVRLSNAATLGYDRWGLNHEFPSGSMQTQGCCTYYWTMSPIVGALKRTGLGSDGIPGTDDDLKLPSVALGTRGAARDHEEEFEPLPGYDWNRPTDELTNTGIAFSDNPVSWPDTWPIESDLTGTYTDAQTGISLAGIERPLDRDNPDGSGLRFPGSLDGKVVGIREAYFVVTDNDPDEGNTAQANGGVGPLDVRVDVWGIQYDDILNEDYIIFKELITNVGSDTLFDVYVGVVGDPDTPEQGGAEWEDDYSLLIRPDDPNIADKLADTTKAELLYNLAMVWDGDDQSEGFLSGNVGWIGLKVLETPFSQTADGKDNDSDGLIDEGFDGIDNDSDGLTDETDEQEEMGITGFRIFEYSEAAQSDADCYNNEMANGIMGVDYFDAIYSDNPHADDIEQKPYAYGPDITWVISSGPFLLPPGETLVFTFADILGLNELDLLNNAKLAQLLYNNDFKAAQPPEEPEVKGVAGDGKVDLYWSAYPSEYSVDPVTGNNTFQGYRIYKSTDRGATWGIPQNDANGTPTSFYVPVALFDKVDDIAGAYSMTSPSIYYNLGSNSGLAYHWQDTDVINGVEYWYAVSAYDSPDVLFGGPVPPMENSRKKNARVPGDNTVSIVPRKDPAAHKKGAAWYEQASGIGDLDLDLAVVDDADLTGEDYLLEFTEDDSGDHAWSLSRLTAGGQIDAVILDKNLTPPVVAAIDGSAPTKEVDGFILTLSDGRYDYDSDLSSANFEQTVNMVDTTTIDYWATISTLFSGATGGTATAYGEWNTDVPDSVILGSTDPHILMQDVEFRFTSPQGGQMGTYYAGTANRGLLHDPDNYVVQTFSWTDDQGSSFTDTLTVHNDRLPFEVWDVENDRQINAYVWLFKSTYSNSMAEDFPGHFKNEPVRHMAAVDKDTLNRFVSVAVIGLVNSDYAPDELHSASDPEATWMLAFNHASSTWEPGDIMRLALQNPIIPGEDEFIVFTEVARSLISESDLSDSLRHLQVSVVPNPYTVTSRYETNIEVKEVQFHGLPTTCTIRIFNTAGELVNAIRHEPISSGYRAPSIEAWNLRSYNDQEVAFGIYLFTVEAENTSGKGKFAVIK